MRTLGRGLLGAVGVFAFALSGCASSTSGDRREPMLVIIQGTRAGYVREGPSGLKFYLVRPVLPADKPKVQVCGRFRETGSRITRDSCQSAVGSNAAVAQTVMQSAARWEDICNSALRRYLKEHELPPATSTSAFALDITRELETEASVYE